MSTVSSVANTLQQQFKIVTTQKKEQIERLPKISEDLTLIIQKLNLSTQEVQSKLSNPIFQVPLKHDLTSKPEDPLEQLIWLVNLAKKIRQRQFDISVSHYIKQLQETVASTEELAKQIENKNQKLDEEIELATKLVEERKKTLDLIKQLNLDLTKKNQERQQ